MEAQRRRHAPEFKARVAIDALKEIKTIQQIAKEYELHPVLVSQWKKRLKEGMSSVFERGTKKGDADFEKECEGFKTVIKDLRGKLDFEVKKIQTARPLKRERAKLVEKNHPELSVRKQCELLDVTRSVVGYQKAGESSENQEILRLMGKIYSENLGIGTRGIVTRLKREYGMAVNRKRISRLRGVMGVHSLD